MLDEAIPLPQPMKTPAARKLSDRKEVAINLERRRLPKNKIPNAAAARMFLSNLPKDPSSFRASVVDILVKTWSWTVVALSLVPENVTLCGVNRQIAFAGSPVQAKLTEPARLK